MRIDFFLLNLKKTIKIKLGYVKESNLINLSLKNLPLVFEHDRLIPLKIFDFLLIVCPNSALDLTGLQTLNISLKYSKLFKSQR